MGNELIYKYKNVDRLNMFITFNNKDYIVKNINDDFTEFLPGIYIKRKMKYKKKFDKYTSSDIEKNNFFVLKMIYYLIWNKIFYDHQDIEIIFKIENKRDNIKIVVNEHSIYNKCKPRVDTLEYKYNENLKTLLNSEYKVEYKLVDTNKILYPYASGGDGERCIIKGIFNHLGLSDRSSFYDDYTFFTEHEMFLASSSIDSLMDICKKFERCNMIYNKFLDNTYKHGTPDNWGDDITLIEANGIYKISNANHRVCLAKRFGIPKVFARVMMASNDNIDTSYKNSHNYGILSKKFNKGNNEKLLKSFYQKLQNLNLGNEEGQYILKNGLRGSELIKYIEKTTEKTIYQLYNELEK